MITEQDLIAGCQQYNKAAQMALYKRHVGKMNALCLRYINSPDDAKDIVQESFIKIFSSIKKFKGEGSFEGWMRRILVNASIDYLNKKKKHVFISIDDAESLHHEDSFSVFAEESDFVEEEFTSEELMEAINGLPEMYKLIFNMHCIENYAHKEIAELLAIKEDTSRSKLRRARVLLRNTLAELSKIKNKIGKDLL
jgi:RNA polymerase sigma-70 factor, ECF subfamily